MPTEQEGRGFGANDLEAMAQKRIRDRLETLHPELMARGVAVLQAQKKAQEDVAQLRTDLHKALGGDGVVTALGMLAEVAKTAPPKPVLPKVGDDDAVLNIVGDKIEEMRRTHQPKSRTTGKSA